MLLRLAEDGSGMPQDRLAQAVLVSEVPAVREMALLLQRVEEQAGHIVYAGERGCLRTRVLRHLLTKGGTQPLAEDGSVLLIDDIDDRSVSEQGEILRLAQQGRRVLATASDRFLDRVKDGSFRRDLYYALGGQPVVAVSLKDRLEDIPTLLEACVVAWGDDRVLDALREYGRNAMPPNVEFSVKEWSQGVEIFRREKVTLIRGESGEGLDRLTELFGHSEIAFERLNKKTVAVRGAKNEKAARDLGEKLHQHGLYVE